MLIKRIRQNPFPGEGFQQGPRIPWLSSAYTINPTAAGNAPALELGEAWQEEGFGNDFEYVHLDISGEAAATLSAGVLLQASTPKADTVAAVLTDATTSVVYGVTLTTGGLTANAEVGNFIWFQDLGLTAMIESNTATNVVVSLKGSIFGNNQYDPNFLPSAPGLGTVVDIIRPWHVKIADDTHPPVGVLLNDTVENNRIVMQIAGLAYILGNGSGTITAVNIPAITTAAGIIQGGTASAAALGNAMILPQVAYDGATLLIPCYFEGNGVR